MNKQFFISALISTFFISCKPKENKHERLIKFNNYTVMNVDEIILSDSTFINDIYSNEFNKSTDTIEYKDQYIYVSYLSIVNGCATYEGNLEIKSDSIILKLNNISGIECTEIRCDRLIYKINNPENKRYTIKKI